MRYFFINLFYERFLMLGRNQKNAGGKYHQTNDVYDYGNTGIDDKVIATTNAVVQLTLKQCSYKLPDTNS